MKKNYTLLVLLILISTTMYSQIVITEIMYNPPESGTDSLEYIELYNAGGSAVDLAGYSFTAGINHVFGSESIGAGEYLVVSVNPEALMNTFGVASIKWESGGLNNGGEAISIADNNGNELDFVQYSPNSPWPTFADGTAGQGASIELCSIEVDNSDPSFWRASQSGTGIIINNNELKGTPGSANAVTCAPVPSATVILSGLSFTPKDITINAGETVLWVNESGVHNVNGSIATYPDNPAGFSSGNTAAAPFEFTHIFTIPGIYNYQCDPHVSAGMVGTVTVLGDENVLWSIADASAVDDNGVAVNLGQSVIVEGKVYGVNLRPGGLQFTIIDGTNEGIGIFNETSTFGYEVSEGDELRVYGAVNQFNGFTQIVPDSIMVINVGIPVVTPRIVTTLDESTESSLVKIEDVMVVDPSQWTGSGTGFNVTVTNGVSEFELRIDNDVVDLYNGVVPAGVFDVTGIGGQFDNTNPFLEGYQLLPRYAADINPYNSVESEFPIRNIASVTTVDGNGVADSLGVKCEVRGIVYGVNFRPSGLQFTIIDEDNDGIGVFNSSGNLGYNFTTGDEISIKGTIGQFNGLTQIAPAEISLLSTGNTLFEPTVVTTLGEETESQYIELQGVSIVDPSQWTGNGGNFNVEISTASGEILTMRIDADVELSSVQLPGLLINVVGIGGQFDSSSPYTSGYQIFPMFESDIMMVSSTGDLLSKQNAVRIYPNPAGEILHIDGAGMFKRLAVYNTMGQRIMDIDGNVNQIPVATLIPGNYYIQFINNSGLLTKSFVKQ